MNEKDIVYARKVFEAYIGTESIKEYNQEIKRLSIESGKNETYLRALLTEFENFCATQEEKEKIKEVRTRNNKKVYIEFVENITSLNNEEIKKQVLSKEIKKTEVVKRFKDYLEKIKDQEKIEIAKKVYAYIMSIYEEIENEEKEKQEKEKHDKVIELFNKIVNEGYITIKDFARENHSKYRMEKKQFIENLYRMKKYLEERNEYKYYEEMLDANRKFTYKQLEQKIDIMLKGLLDNYEKVSCENNYDIIDYYLEIGMNPNTFIELCEGFVDEKEITKLKHFFRYYADYEKYPDVQIPTTINIMGQQIPEEIINEILELMEEHNIQKRYVYICCKKYALGQLDKYLTISKKM